MGIQHLILCSLLVVSAEAYFPPAGVWETRSPEAVGLDAGKLGQAVAFAIENESARPRDQALSSSLGFSREPYNDIIGPTAERGDPAGLIIRHGYIVASWGDPDRVDMTHSITKTFLSTTAAIAFDRGLIRLDDPVHPYVPGEYFDSDHNRQITWDHLLRQTSSFGGTLWSKPDWGDRPEGDDPFAWPDRALSAPGTVYKYNDVRVNVLALALLYVHREPLPAVLRREVMRPIGASNTWHWEGYHNSWVVVDGVRMQSVSGGGHWGGGMFINAYDLGRLGLLTLHRGRWGDQQVFSEDWYRHAIRPGSANDTYGFMNYFLNTRRERFPSAPETAYAHLGAGSNMVYVDPDHDLVIVARWIDRDALDGLIGRVLESIND